MKSKKKKKPQMLSSSYELANISFQDRLDYHELGELTSFDIEKYLFDFLEDSYNSGFTKVLVITGKGQVVRPLVQKLLKQNKFVEEFKQAGYFTGQEGAFEVYIKSLIS